jgi:hypothetical protein
MKNKKIFRYIILFFWIIVLLFGISFTSSIGSMVDNIKNYSNYIELINNEKGILSCDHKAFILGESPDCGAWEFILNNPADLTCICEDGGGSGDFFTGGTWSNEGKILFCQYDSGILYGFDIDTCEMWAIGGGGNSILDLAFDPITNKMFGSSGSNCLYNINPETGEQNLIGPFGDSAGYMYMAFDAEDTLYGWDLLTDSLWTINTETGEATKIGSLGINLNYVCEGDFCKEDNIFYITIPGSPPDYTYQLYESDPETGWSYIGQFPQDVDITAFVIPWNYPPYTPSNPDPPDGATNVSGCSVEWTGGDPDDDFVYYDIYFGNTTSPPKVLSNSTVNNFNYSGFCESNTTYYWKIVSKDVHGASAESPIWSFITMENSPPVAPIIAGPTNGRTQVSYEYNFSIFDPDGDDMFIHIDWEHGTPSKWDGPFPSGSVINYNYSWRSGGKYIIKAQTQDSYGLLSDWGTLEIIIPRNRVSLSQLFLRILYHFPLLEKFLFFTL